jgi:hypothetical protein
MDKADLPPILRVESKSGIAYYPRFHKNTEGAWELNNKSFLNLLKPHIVSEKLTPYEIEQLRQSKKDDNAYFQKAFARLKKAKKV